MELLTDSSDSICVSSSLFVCVLFRISSGNDLFTLRFCQNIATVSSTEVKVVRQLHSVAFVFRLFINFVLMLYYMENTVMHAICMSNLVKNILHIRVIKYTNCYLYSK